MKIKSFVFPQTMLLQRLKVFSQANQLQISDIIKIEMSEIHASKTQKLAKFVKKMNVGEQPSDFAYWQTQPYSARLAALEDLRRTYIAWKYDTEPRFQRVYTIIKPSDLIQPYPAN